MNKIIVVVCSLLSLLSPGLVAQTNECVILLHGLARTSKAMEPLAKYLKEADYKVVNVDYPSREFAIETLAEKAINPALENCRREKPSAIHFVTHSLGGILVRQYMSNHQIPELKRVVMLAPPNQGSQVVDDYKKLPPFGWMNGPAGLQLGTDKNSAPKQLGAVNFDLGVIAGTRTFNPILSLSLPNPDDGKVSVENTKVEGMHDFITLPVSHPFIMKNKRAMMQVTHYLQKGKFDHTPEKNH
jgi:hypothetical protein